MTHMLVLLLLLSLVACSLLERASAQEVYLGSLVGVSYDVSGEVYAIDSRRFRVDGFTYNGRGPRAFFWAGPGGSPSPSGFRLLTTGSGACSTEKLGRYSGSTVIVEMPEGMTVDDIGHIGVWCEPFMANFGSLSFNSGDSAALAALPAPTGALECSEGFEPEPVNCAVLSAGALQVRWMVDTTVAEPSVTFQLEGVVQEDEYMAFGVSGNAGRVQMVGGDVTVARRDGSAFVVEDYFLQARAQCTSGVGACPDAGTDDAVLMEGTVAGGVTRVSFTRPLTPSDVGSGQDQGLTAGAGEQYFIWAIGPTLGDAVRYHTAKDGLQLDLGRDAVDECADLSEAGGAADPCAGLEEPWFREPVVSEELTFRIGPSGGPHGYSAITGAASWGIAWYVNDVLIPVIGVERGTTYTVKVLGGDDPLEPAERHPLYFSSDGEGGFDQQPDDVKLALAPGILAGFDADNMTSVEGPECRLFETDASDALRDGDDFEAYFAALEGNENGTEACGVPGVFTWTPDQDTPDEVFYHCFTHRSLGWRIVVFDAGELDMDLLEQLSAEPVLPEACLERLNGAAAAATPQRLFVLALLLLTIVY